MSELMYFKEFDTVEEYAEYINNDPVLPNISFVGIEGNVNYNPMYKPEPPHDYSKDYLTFEVLENGKIIWKLWYPGDSKTIYYSKDNGNNWVEIISTIEGTEIDVIEDDVVLFKGYNDTYKISSSFESTSKVNISGNIMSMIYGDNFIGKTEFPEGTELNFMMFFGTPMDEETKQTKVISAKNLILPATTLTEDCYDEMFQGCSLLVEPPELPATTLAPYCYVSMFAYCTSLEKAPVLPATTLAPSCYSYMFQGCTSLTTPPELPATTLAKECYGNMFNGCTSLTTTPELPATTLAQGCYYSMFYGCTGLTEHMSILPATVLNNSCYYDMFENCSSLTTMPILPSHVLTPYCYFNMFAGCTNLLETTILGATTLVEGCYGNMFFNCTSLEYIECLATNINAVDCTTGWVENVASNGTFVKSQQMNDWTTGISGIPDGWNVQDA